MIPNSNEPQPRDDGDPLHHLLREAQWPQPIQDAEARLTQCWRDAWSARRRREMLTRRAAALAVAASLLVAAAVGYGGPHRADKLVCVSRTGPGIRPENRSQQQQRERERGAHRRKSRFDSHRPAAHVPFPRDRSEPVSYRGSQRALSGRVGWTGLFAAPEEVPKR